MMYCATDKQFTPNEQAQNSPVITEGNQVTEPTVLSENNEKNNYIALIVSLCIAVVIAVSVDIFLAINHNSMSSISNNVNTQKEDEQNNNNADKKDLKEISDLDELPPEEEQANTVEEYVGPDQTNGNIGDHVKGDLSKAKVVIVEYTNYKCSFCQVVWHYTDKALNSFSDGELAVIYRSYNPNNDQNGKAAAIAAEAAGFQGFWQEYADTLFAKASEWQYEEGQERDERFIKFFEEATKGKGDVELFKKDMSEKIDQIEKKLSFDNSMAERDDVNNTPTLLIDRKEVDISKHYDDENAISDIIIKRARSKMEGTTAQQGEIDSIVTQVVQYQANNRGKVPSTEEEWNTFWSRYLIIESDEYKYKFAGNCSFEEYGSKCKNMSDLKWDNDQYKVYIVQEARCTEDGLGVMKADNRKSVAIYTVLSSGTPYCSHNI